MRQAEQWRTPEYLALLAGWNREGVSREEMAERIGIAPGTLQRWAREVPEIAAALAGSGETADYQVEAALLKKALGYESVEKKVELSPRGDRKEVETTKQVGPDMSAISLWLKKRRPERWGDGAAGSPPPNNLMEKLEEGGEADTDGIPELQ